MRSAKQDMFAESWSLPFETRPQDAAGYPLRSSVAG